MLKTDDATQELLQLNQRLLDAIAQGDWATYEKLCDPGLTAFEPEARGQLVEGLEFHRFYFRPGGARGPHATTMCQPRVRVMGDVAVVSYVRLNQRVGPDASQAWPASRKHAFGNGKVGRGNTSISIARRLAQREHSEALAFYRTRWE